MPGFATASKTNHKSLINQHLKTNPFLNRFGKGTYQLAVADQRLEWDRHYIGRNDSDEMTLDDLFSPEVKKLYNEETENLAPSHAHLTNVGSSFAGFWGLTYTYDPREGEWDFTFMVKVGKLYQFHPRAIRQRIISQFDEETYNQWKVAVMGDWDNLMSLKDSWTPPKKVVTSIACSPSAEALCRKMGFETRGGVVFWITD